MYSRTLFMGAMLMTVLLIGVPGIVGAADTTKPDTTKSDTVKSDTAKPEGTVEKTKGAVKGAEETAKTGISDSWLTSKTKIALFADERVKGTQVNVQTHKGVVMLRGKVDSPEAKSAAGDIAQGINGVKSVKNELQVVPSSTRKATDRDDKEIMREVKTHLAKDPELKQAKVSVRVDAGVVTLTGEVPSVQMSARASEAARSVTGVRSVQNDLTFARQGRSSSSTDR